MLWFVGFSYYPHKSILGRQWKGFWLRSHLCRAVTTTRNGPINATIASETSAPGKRRRRKQRSTELFQVKGGYQPLNGAVVPNGNGVLRNGNGVIKNGSAKKKDFKEWYV